MKKTAILLSVLLVAFSLLPAQSFGDVSGSTSTNSIVINEINSSPDDWVEVMNTGDSTLDLSGFELRDNSDDHRWRFADGTTLDAGKLFVVDANTTGLVYDDTTKAFSTGTFGSAIGLGSGDSVRLYDNTGKLLDEYSWTSHASYDGDGAKASYGRYPDGTGAFRLTKETKGLANDYYKPNVVINEIESNGDATDWVEVINTGSEPVDISGWYVLDNDPMGHKADVTPVPSGTVLAVGDLYVFDQNKAFTFGLGKEDQATVYDADGAIVDSYAWTSHANGVYARIPDGTGAFQDLATSTKGKRNEAVNPVVINEVQSNDPDGGADWIELANPTSEELDISGIVILDSKDKDPYTIPEGTKIPANGFLVIKQDDTGVNGFAFGLGEGDSVRLFEKGKQIASTAWPADTHTDPTWGLYPDVNGTTYKNTAEATPGAANKFSDTVQVIDWPGSNEVKVYDTTSTFLEDSSGLDFSGGKLYAVDNGTATFWVMDVAKDGTLSFTPGFESGKRVSFRKDAGNASAKGPDAEGITVDGNGMVYLASERDNSDKGTNYDTVLMVDPNTSGTTLTAQKEWDITSSLPSVSANMGIEAVEWVSNADITGKLIDKNTGKPFDPTNYPDACAGGVFFVALEDNGHIYAYVLNSDETAVQIADIDSRLGGAMALDYDTYTKTLWATADDGYANRMARISFNGTETPEITHVLPATGVDTTSNNEGFAIATADYTVNGQRPVYRFRDGVASGALTIGSMDSTYKAATDPSTGEPTGDPSETGKITRTTTTTITKKAVTSPQTGDISSIGTWMILMAVSGGIAVLLVLAMKRRERIER